MLSFMATDGFLLIDKPAGMTSFQVCKKINNILSAKRIGHTGTLDPFATGLLVVAVGQATKLINHFPENKKTYHVRIELGKTSETLDPDTTIDTVWNGYIPTQHEIEELLNTKFSGSISQIPPIISAVKINGHRSYFLARTGKSQLPTARTVKVFSTTIISYTFPFLELEVSVGSGFYIRSLARDVGAELCGGGICLSLRRTELHGFAISQAQPIAEVTEQSVFSISDVLGLETLKITSHESYRLQCGQKLRVDHADGLVCLHDEVQLIGFGRIKDGVLQPKNMIDNNPPRHTFPT